ncbi:vacuolar protein sorting-associated protein 54 [Salvelinus sp. IW2-2015]|uniref:vacuolar protein sorting-associated protein 54 n=1 Tax=Salvelinus sp. IW2-2015 TaxID=2691554 RepID=UPI0038D35ECB
MASSHSSSPVPHPSSGGSEGIFRKDRDPSSRHYRPVHSLPDVCPKEPTAEVARGLCEGPSVVADQHRWTVYNSKVNLPAALNDPRLAKRESDFFTKTWGLDFAETEVMPSFYLPNITKEHFGPYLQETAQREKIHERCKSICSNKDELDAVSSITNNHDKSRTELEQVPKIFMKPDFALDDPTTFNAVLPWSHFNSAGGKSSRDMASSRLLQEKLSHYLDVVEVSIARQISLRSEAFFHAMSSQHELQDRLTETARAVAVLRGRTAAIERIMCEGPLRALRQALTRSNCARLHNKLKLMAAVHQSQPTVQLLLSTSEFVGALELIATTRRVWPCDVSDVPVSPAPPPLPTPLGCSWCEMEKLIEQWMWRTLSMYSRSDLQQESGRKTDRSWRRLKKLTSDIVTKLADQMRLMTFPQWFELLKSVFENFVLFLKRIKATLSVVRNVVLEALDSNQKSRLLERAAAGGLTEAPGTPLNQEEAELAYLTHEGLFISDALNDAQLHLGASTGQEQSSTVGPRQALSRMDGCGSDSASGTTESSSSREHAFQPGGAAISSSEDMMPSDLELGRVANNIQELLYTASDVSHDRCVKVLSGTALCQKSSMARAMACCAGTQSKLCWSLPILDGAVCPKGDGYHEQANRFCHRSTRKRKTKSDYYAVTTRTPPPTRCGNSLEWWAHFNPRELPAGPGRQGALPTKNLALASRCLQLVVHYIPIIRAHFETKLTPKQYSVLRHFDHITKDYNDHIAEISAKLMTIMDSLFEKVLSKYEVKAPMPSACFRNVCKQMGKMHEALYELLPEEQAQVLFLRINASFKMHLKRQLARLGVHHDGGPQHGLVTVDVAFYTENVQSLRALEKLDLNMAEIWEQKR